MQRTVFFISDGTGITAEALGHSLLTQFDTIDFETHTIPYVNTEEAARTAVERIQAAYEHDRQPPLVFTTLVNEQLQTLLQQSSAVVLDFFKTFIGPLEKTLQTRSSHTVGRTHGVQNDVNYMLRIEAVNFAMANDDGINVREYQHADLILIGVSRCGKTPTCLYLALQFGLYAANYPLTEDDLTMGVLPKVLQPYRDKLFGLTIDPQRLQQIRQERRPDSQYAALSQCQKEVAAVEYLFKKEQVAFLDTTRHSVEEISAAIMAPMGLKRRLL